MLASHVPTYLGTIKTVKDVVENGFPYYDQVRNYLPIIVPLEINTLGFNKNILQPRSRKCRPLTLLECTEYITTTVGGQSTNTK